MAKVGIIANPVSACDIRRVISYAGNVPVHDRANIVLRVIAGLSAAGVSQVLVMPDSRGIRVHLMRGIERERRLGNTSLPDVAYIDMPVTSTAADGSVSV